jgi:hypothetical protein
MRELLTPPLKSLKQWFCDLSAYHRSDKEHPQVICVVKQLQAQTGVLDSKLPPLDVASRAIPNPIRIPTTQGSNGASWGIDKQYPTTRGIELDVTRQPGCGKHAETPHRE